MRVGYIFTQGPLFHIPKNWMLLDACSLFDVYNNRDLVADIRMCSQTDSLTVRANGGAQRHYHAANIKFLPSMVIFKESSVATILSLKTASEIKGSKIIMDASVNKSVAILM